MHRTDMGDVLPDFLVKRKEPYDRPRIQEARHEESPKKRTSRSVGRRVEGKLWLPAVDAMC